MNKNELAVNLVCFWQTGGWHGCNKIIRYNKHFVYYKTYPIEDDLMHRKSLSKFLEQHELYDLGRGSYIHNHKDVRKIVP